MIQTKPLTGQCPHCGAPAERLAYHSRYALRSGQTGEWDKTGARPPFAVPIHRNVLASPDTTGEMLSEGLHSKPVSELVITDAPLAPTHLLLLHHPLADHIIDRRFHKRRRDRCSFGTPA